VRDLPDLLQAGDALVVNDTKVIPARLTGRRIGRGRSRGSSQSAQKDRRFALARFRAAGRSASRRATSCASATRATVCFLGQLDATVEEKGEGGEVTLSFAFHGSILDQAIASGGHAAAALYRLQAARRRCRPQRLSDAFRAGRRVGRGADRGLHFTDDLAARLAARGVALHRLTLHVGAGTFLPVKADDTSGHAMHPEWGAIDEATAPRSTARGRRAGALSPSARPPCGSWKARPARIA
jgi:S-adenosylmethionine:tRNA ribosyltransferase-isomerase